MYGCLSYGALRCVPYYPDRFRTVCPFQRLTLDVWEEGGGGGGNSRFLTDEQMGSSGGWSPLAPGSKWESDLGSDLQAPFSSSGMTEESSLGY